MKSNIVTPESEIKQLGNWVTCKECDEKFKFVDTKQRTASQASDIWKKELKSTCPKCEIEYCNRQPMERKLAQIQDKYFESGRQQRFIDELFVELSKYSVSLIKKFNQGLPEMVLERIDDYARDVTSLVIQEYTNPDFKIHTSFSGFIFPKTKQALYATHIKFIDAETIHFKYDDGTFSELEDKTKNEIHELYEKEEKDSVASELTDIVFDLSVNCWDKKENYTRLLMINLFLEKGRWGQNYVDRAYERTLDRPAPLSKSEDGFLSVEETITRVRRKLKELNGINTHTFETPRRVFKSITSKIESVDLRLKELQNKLYSLQETPYSLDTLTRMLKLRYKDLVGQEKKVKDDKANVTLYNDICESNNSLDLIIPNSEIEFKRYSFEF